MRTKLSILLVLIATTLVAQSIPKFVKVAGGTFTMGDEFGVGKGHEQPTHQVTLSDFSISKTEVTVGQYRKYCNTTGVSMPYEPSWGWQDNHPIVNVNWNDAINYCDWLSEELDKNITLPTEAQWEFAARGGNQSQGYKYSGGRSVATAGWYSGNSDGQTHAVGGKKPNELGLYDMSGNVWEWILDTYDAKFYDNSPTKNPKNMKGKSRVLRGGGWRSTATGCRVADRVGNGGATGWFYHGVGFRVVYF